MAERVQVSSKKLWSDQEVLILRTMFPSASCYECLQALPGRSWSAIQNMGRYTIRTAKMWPRRIVLNGFL